jgi:hypothetical protein
MVKGISHDLTAMVVIVLGTEVVPPSQAHTGQQYSTLTASAVLHSVGVATFVSDVILHGLMHVMLYLNLPFVFQNVGGLGILVLSSKEVKIIWICNAFLVFGY